jgi:hypothetical protein
MIEFFRTVMGKRYYEGHVPAIAMALKSIANELKRYNDAKEKENG